jgi:hypothetical protein
VSGARAVRAPQGRPARTTARTPAPGVNLALYAAVGHRKALRYLVFWHAVRITVQWAYDHKRATCWALGVLLLFGAAGDLTLALAAACSLGWWLLAREREPLPRWAPPAGLRPWHRPVRPSAAGYFRGFLDAWRCKVLAVASALLQPWLELLTGPALAALVGCAVLVLIAHLRVPPDRRRPWTDEDQLLALLTDPHVNVLRGDNAWCSRQGHPHRDDRGEHVTFTLSGAATWQMVAGKRREVASYLGVPTGQVQVTHADGWAEGKLTLSKLRPRESTAGGLSPVALLDRADATLPVPVGTDEDTDERLTVPMLETNDLDTGVMGSGKTEGSRPVLGTVLLDQQPRAHGQRGAWLFGCDGKGSRKDYGLVAPLAERWVWGTDEDAPEQLVAMLQTVLRIVRYRNRVDETGDVDWPVVQLWLEEFQDIRDAATREQQAQIDECMRRIKRMGRAVRVRGRILTQRSSVEDIPSSYRNLLVIRTAYRAGNPRDYSMALGISGNPDVRVPTAEHGQAILRRFGTIVALVPDRFPLPEWKALCARAAELRADRPQPAYFDALPSSADTVLVELEEQPPAGPPPVVPRPPLLDAAMIALEDAGRPLLASQLLTALPFDLRPRTARDLGLALGALLEQHPDTIERTRAGKSLGWGLTKTSERVPA